MYLAISNCFDHLDRMRTPLCRSVSFGVTFGLRSKGTKVTKIVGQLRAKLCRFRQHRVLAVEGGGGDARWTDPAWLTAGGSAQTTPRKRAQSMAAPQEQWLVVPLSAAAAPMQRTTAGKMAAVLLQDAASRVLQEHGCVKHGARAPCRMNAWVPEAAGVLCRGLQQLR